MNAFCELSRYLSLPFFPDVKIVEETILGPHIRAHLWLLWQCGGAGWLWLLSDAPGWADACELSVPRRGIVSEGSGLALQAAVQNKQHQHWWARVNPLHPEGLCAGYSGLPHSSRLPVSGQGPLCYTFPPRCDEAQASGTISCPSLGPRCGARGSL